MGMRFRKSIKIAPGVKVNLNKNSVSATVGTKGAHYTVNSKGKKTATVGVPGTGLSYTTSSGGGKTKKSNQSDTMNVGSATPPKKKKGKGCLTVFIILFILGGIGSLFTGDDNPTKITISANTNDTYDINTTIPISAECEPSDAELDGLVCETSGGNFANNDGKLTFTANEAGSYKIYVSCGSVESNTLTLTIEDKAAIRQQELEEQKKAEEEAASQPTTETQTTAETQTQQSLDDPLVYITNTGDKYHRSSCRFLKDSKIEKHLSEVIGSYEPCGVCNPPQ